MIVTLVLYIISWLIITLHRVQIQKSHARMYKEQGLSMNRWVGSKMQLQSWVAGRFLQQSMLFPLHAFIFMVFFKDCKYIFLFSLSSLSPSLPPAFPFSCFSLPSMPKQTSMAALVSFWLWVLSSLAGPPCTLLMVSGHYTAVSVFTTMSPWGHTMEFWDL